eukprot:2986778-Alexandrium_andersonii.AAC.1
MVIVDPAGLHHIRELGPQGAGAAAGSIYRWLGLQDAAAFPDAVRQAITREGQAKFHSYSNGEKQCIHAVGPDFRRTFATEDSASAQLEE